MSSQELQMQISDTSFVSVCADQISSDLGGEIVILNLKTGVYHGLNEVGSRIWDLIQQPKPVKDIQAALLAEYEVTLEECDRDLQALLQDLIHAELIEVKNETAA
ncbi:PqqD family peptide modification chaperone [Calothrix sp. 336/3]|uniref:PqqD family peptide modification chaperone n=1 Tax=Calothrix sp. 336/3 TaxID=1337936 RepID=UPI0004E3C4E8|nr:PqqD family peptide modification chaperone [Calothrix sp. 336/3]AKG20936.1 thymidylate synthase [Calothrix sp. 336/3]